MANARGVRSVTLGIVASATLHAVAMLWLPSAAQVSVAPHGTDARGWKRTLAPSTPVDLEIVATPPDRSGAQLPSLGPDSDGNRLGGDGRSHERTWLLDQAHPLTLQDSSFNGLTDSQVQRIDTTAHRASWENRRATLHPDDDLLVTTGNGWIRQRAPSSRTAPAAGHDTPTVRVRAIGVAEEITHETGATSDHQARGSEQKPPAARGRRDTHGTDPVRSVPMRTSRPDVDPGPPATLAAEAGRVQDNRNAELRAAQLMHAFVQSGAAGREPGAGLGGPAEVDGTPGVGVGTRVGGSSRARGHGGDNDPGGERYIHWYSEQRDRIARVLVFPRGRQLALDQGTTLLRVAVGRDGGLLGPPQILRSSGFADLDQAALAAVLQSAPFSPLPDEIAPDSPRIRVTLPIEFWNPTVH